MLFTAKYWATIDDCSGMKMAVQRKWLVVCICCLIGFLQKGEARLSGMLFLPAMARYSTDRTHASLPFVLSYSVRNLVSPLVGYLGDRFGLRFITVVGCVVSSIAIGGSFFAEDIITFTFLWGGIFGLGLGLGTVLASQILNEHFGSKSALANGMALGGECLAGFALPAIVDILLKRYGFSGTLLVLSGLMMQSIPLAMLLWPPKKDGNNIRKCMIDNKIEVINGKPLANDTYVHTESNTSSYSETELNPVMYSASANQQNDTEKNQHFQEYSELTLNIKSLPHLGRNKIEMENSTYTNEVFCGNNFKSHQNCRHLQTFTSHKSMQPVLLSYQRHTSEFESEHNGVNRARHKKPATARYSAFHPFRVFLDPAFGLILFTQSCIVYLLTFINTILIDFGRDIGVEEREEPYLVMSLNIGDAIGRFFLGIITDRGYLSIDKHSALCFSVMGSVLLALLWLRGFEVLTSALFLFGLSFGGIMPVLPGMCSQFTRREQLAMALASRYFLYFPMSWTQSPLIGLFRGQWGSYKPIILLMLVLCFVCAITSLLTPYVAKRRDRKQTMKGHSQIALR